jgi:hypothetical protein
MSPAKAVQQQLRELRPLLRRERKGFFSKIDARECHGRNRMLGGDGRKRASCLAFKMSHDRGWRDPCCSEHGS